MGAGLRLGAALLAAIVCGSAGAQVYPQRPVRMIVGLPPGGSTDIMARMVSARLTERLGQQVVVDNRPGANGIIGIQLVASALPDGHTLIMGAGSFGTIGSLYREWRRRAWGRRDTRASASRRVGW